MTAWGRNYGRSPKCRSDRVALAGYRVRCGKPMGHRGEHAGRLPLWPAIARLGRRQPVDYVWGEEKRAPLRESA